MHRIIKKFPRTQGILGIRGGKATFNAFRVGSLGAKKPRDPKSNFELTITPKETMPYSASIEPDHQHVFVNGKKHTLFSVNDRGGEVYLSIAPIIGRYPTAGVQGPYTVLLSELKKVEKPPHQNLRTRSKLFP